MNCGLVAVVRTIPAPPWKPHVMRKLDTPQEEQGAMLLQFKEMKELCDAVSSHMDDEVGERVDGDCNLLNRLSVYIEKQQLISVVNSK